LTPPFNSVATLAKKFVPQPLSIALRTFEKPSNRKVDKSPTTIANTRLEHLFNTLKFK